MASVCGHRSRSSRNRAANRRQAGASSATGYQTVNCSSNSVLHRIGCAFGKNPALMLYQIVAELISKNRVQTPKLASQGATLRAGPLAPRLSESSVPGSIAFFNIKSLCSENRARKHWHIRRYGTECGTDRVPVETLSPPAPGRYRSRYCTNVTWFDLVIGSSNNQPHYGRWRPECETPPQLFPTIKPRGKRKACRRSPCLCAFRAIDQSISCCDYIAARQLAGLQFSRCRLSRPWSVTSKDGEKRACLCALSEICQVFIT